MYAFGGKADMAPAAQNVRLCGARRSARTDRGFTARGRRWCRALRCHRAAVTARLAARPGGVKPRAREVANIFFNFHRA
jgi:hypothetical protein